MKTYIFTFGSGQKNAGHFVRVEAEDFMSARRKMISVFGSEWAFQYTKEEWDKWCDKVRSMGGEVFLETEIPFPFI